MRYKEKGEICMNGHFIYKSRLWTKANEWLSSTVWETTIGKDRHGPSVQNMLNDQRKGMRGPSVQHVLKVTITHQKVLNPRWGNKGKCSFDWFKLRIFPCEGRRQICLVSLRSEDQQIQLEPLARWSTVTRYKYGFYIRPRILILYLRN